MLKPYKELVKIDVLPFCSYREAKDDSGKKIKVPYLNWARCKELLHQNGADNVYFEPVYNTNGHSLFMSDIEFTDKNGNKNRCYEVRVRTIVDDQEWITNYALLNGSFIVRDDTMNQLRVSNAQARAFVKGVAVHTGLGFNLWLNHPDSEDFTIDDLQIHNIYQIKKRIEQTITAKIQNGFDYKDMLSSLGLNDKQFKVIMGYFDTIGKLEQKVNRL